MNREQKRKLRLIAALGIALLIGGTFAFTAFNQQAVNDRDRYNAEDIGGRVHDYYDEDSENKDIFVENYDANEIMARIRLSEFMSIQERNGTEESIPADGERENLDTWAVYKPEAGHITVRAGGNNNRFNTYSALLFGRAGTAPWYLPTFNHNHRDGDADRTAAAGDARDLVDDNQTHPGDGTDDYWSEGEPYENTGTWPGSTVTRYTTQHLQEDRAPMTMEEWVELDDAYKIGNFWVMDEGTGWAYWANKLEGGQATSYLLDAAPMTGEADNINGSYYYGIHVTSGLVSPGNREQFLETDEHGEHHRHLEDFLNGIYTGEMEAGWALPTQNPPANQPSDVGDFNFGLMSDTAGANTLFTLNTPVGPQQFRYLENMGNGNHLIIRNEAIREVSWYDHESHINMWFNTELPADLRAMVAPVATPFTTGIGTFSVGGGGWSINSTELANNSEVAADLTAVVPLTNGGVRRAFALSLADVQRLSAATPGIGFMSNADRAGANSSWWWLRTPSTDTTAWTVLTNGALNVGGYRPGIQSSGGVRPAFILHQEGT